MMPPSSSALTPQVGWLLTSAPAWDRKDQEIGMGPLFLEPGMQTHHHFLFEKHQVHKVYWVYLPGCELIREKATT